MDPPLPSLRRDKLRMDANKDITTDERRWAQMNAGMEAGWILVVCEANWTGAK
jgi:hypothetical protein